VNDHGKTEPQKVGKFGNECVRIFIVARSPAPKQPGYIVVDYPSIGFALAATRQIMGTVVSTNIRR
jgi:hypothetical protein